jgi:hypothetical protein
LFARWDGRILWSEENAYYAKLANFVFTDVCDTEQVPCDYIAQTAGYLIRAQGLLTGFRETRASAVRCGEPKEQ